MLFLLAVSAQAQSPYYGGSNIYAGTPALAYAGPQSYYVPPPVATPPSNPAFDLSQMNRQVDAARYQAQGKNLLYNVNYYDFVPESSFNLNGFAQYGNYLKAKGSKIDENRLDREIDYFRATHPVMSIEDRNKLDDLILQREAARNTKLRRAVSIIPGGPGTAIFGPFVPGGGPISAFFDTRAQQDNLQLARNSLYDARQAIVTAPSQSNVIALKNARDNVDQATARRSGSLLDLSGSLLGPVFRKKASQEKLDIGFRNLKVAQAAYAQDPSTDNLLNLKLANLFIRATSQEDDSNTDGVVATSLFGTRGFILGNLLGAKNSQDEADLWLKYNRLQRLILIRQQQKQLSDANPVAQRMLGLQSYGSNANQGSGSDYPNDRSTLSGGASGASGSSGGGSQ